MNMCQDSIFYLTQKIPRQETIILCKFYLISLTIYSKRHIIIKRKYVNYHSNFTTIKETNY